MTTKRARMPFPSAEIPRNWRGELELIATFRGALAIKLISIARERNQHPTDMLASLVEAAVDDNLVSSIIDDDDDEKGVEPDA